MDYSMITNAVVIKTILAMMETELIALARPKSLPICAVKGGLALATGAKNTITSAWRYSSGKIGRAHV